MLRRYHLRRARPMLPDPRRGAGGLARRPLRRPRAQSQHPAGVPRRRGAGGSPTRPDANGRRWPARGGAGAGGPTDAHRARRRPGRHPAVRGRAGQPLALHGTLEQLAFTWSTGASCRSIRSPSRAWSDRSSPGPSPATSNATTTSPGCPTAAATPDPIRRWSRSVTPSHVPVFPVFPTGLHCGMGSSTRAALSPNLPGLSDSRGAATRASVRSQPRRITR